MKKIINCLCLVSIIGLLTLVSCSNPQNNREDVSKETLPIARNEHPCFLRSKIPFGGENNSKDCLFGKTFQDARIDQGVYSKMVFNSDGTGKTYSKHENETYHLGEVFTYKIDEQYLLMNVTAKTVKDYEGNIVLVKKEDFIDWALQNYKNAYAKAPNSESAREWKEVYLGEVGNDEAKAEELMRFKYSSWLFGHYPYYKFSYTYDNSKLKTNLAYPDVEKFPEDVDILYYCFYRPGSFYDKYEYFVPINENWTGNNFFAVKKSDKSIVNGTWKRIDTDTNHIFVITLEGIEYEFKFVSNPYLSLSFNEIK